jgi:hypothetical protein
VEQPGLSAIQLNDLHGDYLFSQPYEESLVVSGWNSLSSFYGWVAGQIDEGLDNREIYAAIDDRLSAGFIPVAPRLARQRAILNPFINDPHNLFIEHPELIGGAVEAMRLVRGLIAKRWKRYRWICCGGCSRWL